MNTTITNIEQEIQELTKHRAILFEQWAVLIKQNDREFEKSSVISFDVLYKADELLREQRSISKKILDLLDKMEDLRKIQKT